MIQINNMLKKAEKLLENIVNNSKNKINKALDDYEYLTKFTISLITILFIFLVYWLLDKSSNQISILISVISLIISSYLGFKKQKSEIKNDVSITKNSGIFIEMYSNNNATCIVNIESIILLNDSSIIKSFYTEDFSKELPNEVVKSYILSNDSISLIPIVYVERQKIGALGDIGFLKMNLAQSIKGMFSDELDFSRVTNLSLKFSRSDKASPFYINLDFNDVLKYEY